MQHISWDEWFGTFDERDLTFVYHAHTRDGRQSNFFRLVSPHREDGRLGVVRRAELLQDVAQISPR